MNELCEKESLGVRNDTMGMQYLIPGWKFDNRDLVWLGKSNIGIMLNIKGAE